jgi:N-acetylmuramoyl-L-alanine amidase
MRWFTSGRTGAALATAATAAALLLPAGPASAVTDICDQLGSTTLSVSSKGTAVRNLQTCLNKLGMMAFTADGAFGDNTKHAVITAQKIAGLTRDGVVGARTKAWLGSAVPVTLPAAPSGSPRTAVIDIASQVMYIQIDGRTRVVDVSTGSEQLYTNPQDGSLHRAHTPRGYFAINRHIAGAHESSEGLGLMYYPSYFDLQGHAVHGSTSVPTSPASHGCVRVTRALERIVQNALAIGVHLYIR